jgi:hypothetical protein
MGFTTMALRTSPFRLAFLVFGLMAGSAVFGASAFAQQICGNDIARLTKAREVELDRINGVVRAAKGKRLDPAVFCPHAASLNSAENALIAYMEKNKDWCGVPDGVVSSLKANHEKSLAFSRKLCRD